MRELVGADVQLAVAWEEFAAGYILGRCLHFDDEQFGHWYTEMLHAHQVLTTHAESPWRTISWA
ncbi:DUF1266 domain-containing protein [Streptomyces decoyicus]|uniref:DUF1266 domain-containing protein n=1 Tax=Streptomyces decoyicus TaxID=249567 RepID=UPI0033A1B76C